MKGAFANLRGRVLVVGTKDSTAGLLQKLARFGYFCALAEDADAVLNAAQKLKPEAILLAGPPKKAEAAMNVIRSDSSLREVPVLADLSHGRAEAMRALAEDWVHSYDELTQRLESALRARRLVERENAARLRMEVLLEITQAATSSLELEKILSIAVDKVGRVIPADRCSVVLVEGDSPRMARVVASRELPDCSPFPLDLARYPELRYALKTRQSVCIEDAARDPLMEEVRRYIAPLGVKSVLVQPLICHDDLFGALYLRITQSDVRFGREEQELAQTVAASLANSIRNARLHAALKKKREDLESAYVDRYRELSEANRRLKELNRLKDEVISVLSHDLRAPLQVLLGHARLLLDSQLDDSQRLSADAVLRMGKKILDLVENLLERGKGEGARLSLEPRSLDVSEICKESAAELEILARERGVALRAETPESLLAIGDEVRLRQVLQNLITNAIHHARTEVVVRAQRLKRPDGDAAKVMVHDDGAGIPAEELHLVFDRFHTRGGTGLGLTICKDNVELHGGEIWAENPPEGGCSFVFTLPLQKSIEPGRANLPVAEPGKQWTVLVVEDEPEIAAVMSEILRSRYKVEVARDGAEGVAKARAIHPDLVLMDVFLPKLDGLEATVSLKASGDTADIPVILVSAHQGVSDKVRALNLGAVDYLGKPFQAMELLARCERALKLRTAERELQKSLSMLKRAGSDPATGLFDRSGALSRLEQELARCRRYGRTMSVAVLEPEQPVGTKVAVAASLVRRNLRAPDIVGHLGEGTFVVVLPESTHQAACSIVNRLAPELQNELGLRYRLAVVEPSGESETAEALLERALAALPRFVPE